MLHPGLLAALLLLLAGCLGGNGGAIAPGPDDPGASREPTNTLEPQQVAGPKPEPEPAPSNQTTPSNGTNSGAEPGAKPEPSGSPRAIHIDTGFLGPEPTIVSAADGTLFLAAVGGVPGGDDYILRSLDGGHTWEVSYDYPGFGPTQIPNLDPMLEIDPVSDAVYAVAQINDWCTDMAVSTDLGETWSEARPACNRPPVDHVKLVAAPPGPEAILGDQLHPSVLTLCANTGRGLQTSCLISYDGGTTWPVEQGVFNLITGCTGLVGKPEAARDGTIAIPAVWGCSHFTAAFSRDNGLTWAIETSPLERGHAINPGAGFTPDGTFYGAARGTDERVHVVRFANDQWSGPWPVTPPDVQSTVFVTAEAGSNGRVAVAFLGTDAANVHPTDAPDDAHWHLYMAWSLDADSQNPTWHAARATPDGDPVQIGSICLVTRPCTDGNRNLLDFIDSAITPDGTFVVAYADGCIQTCVDNPEASPADSRAKQAKVAILEGVDFFD